MLQTAAAAEQAWQDAVAEAGPLREQLARLKREQQAAQKDKRDLLQRCKELSQEVATLHVSLAPPYVGQDCIHAVTEEWQVATPAWNLTCLLRSSVWYLVCTTSAAEASFCHKGSLQPRENGMKSKQALRP